MARKDKIKPTLTKLSGFSNGRMVDYHDGTIGYWTSGHFLEQFRVRVADITGFSTTKDKQSKALEVTFRIFGNGGELAAVSVSGSAPQKIEEYFRSHPGFAGVQSLVISGTASQSAVSVADELRKLADLHASGVLTDDEFAAQKAKVSSSRMLNLPA